MFSENVIDASRSQICLLMSVSRGGLRRNNCIRLIGLAVLSGGTVYPGKKSHKRKDSKLRVLQLRKYLSNEIISRSNKQTKQTTHPQNPTRKSSQVLTHHTQQNCLRIPSGNFQSLADNLLVLPYHSSSRGESST